jgi:hypothetical protein
LNAISYQAQAKTASPSLSAPIEDKWAVVIGIGDFVDPGIPKLKYSSKDARDFYDYLVDPTQGKFKPDHVRLLLDRNATKINIMDALGDSFLPHAANPKDSSCNISIYPWLTSWSRHSRRQLYGRLRHPSCANYLPLASK